MAASRFDAIAQRFASHRTALMSGAALGATGTPSAHDDDRLVTLVGTRAVIQDDAIAYYRG